MSKIRLTDISIDPWNGQDCWVIGNGKEILMLYKDDDLEKSLTVAAEEFAAPWMFTCFVSQEIKNGKIEYIDADDN